MITLNHLLSLLLTFLLFAFVNIFYKIQKRKTALVLHQLLRLSYLLVLLTGILLLPVMPITFGRMFKFLLGVLTMGFMEIFLMHRRQGDLGFFHWTGFGVLLGATIAMGLFLPLGWYLVW
ncbi:DUF1516 family protein [Shouchella shacheensis]|uniref:DUF1516 family protein n=1 Tax=Shouchella shacheensis TaxID=1649580 RepID=UPI0007401C62|nr:DUF1516 family protein [Shouchella shacheensis]